ncbi:MAG: hypothetical protein AABX39_05950 [Nanoarchaeota archaeon]
MIFQLEGLVERTVKEKKDLVDFVNNYDSQYSKSLTEHVYNSVVWDLKRKYLTCFAIGASYVAIFKFVNDEAQTNNYRLLDFASILGLAVFAAYTLINVVRIIELETNEEEILRQSRECAQKGIKDRLGIKN